ncbi:MAG: 5'/3'-nucleotidase SurE [Chloroflexi bacterium]|nr:5'/3'-nucleotidase SurE [Chloroflexota bacterium]
MSNKPLIMLTNDDGIASPGLLALIRAARPLGDLLIVAPRHQQSGTGRSYVMKVGVTETHLLNVDGETVQAYSVEASPAQCVHIGLLVLTPRMPDLLISGINYGENVGSSVTLSGTVGAAWEAATVGVPALAVSIEVDVEHHFAHSDAVDFSVSGRFAHRFAAAILQNGLPPGADIINVNVPQQASDDTPWRMTRVSRYTHFHDTIQNNDLGEKVITGYHRNLDLSHVEPDSDLYVLFHDQVVVVTPLTVDTTSRADFGDIQRRLVAP